MIQNRFPGPYGNPMPVGWSLLLPYWATAPAPRARSRLIIRTTWLRSAATSVVPHRRERHP
jgi:hypothetical protein